MKCISKVAVVNDDVLLAELSDGSEVQLFELASEWKTYYKVKVWNRIAPVWTKMSWCFFTDQTRRIYL